MNTPQDSSLGHEVAYPSHYDAGLLFPIPRAAGRAGIGLAGGVPGSSPGQALPFIGHDRWHAYEISWLDARGKPHVATATFTVPCTSPNLVESKSLKLFLGSFRNHAGFHEDCTVGIGRRLFDEMQPRWLRIGGYWYPRGGIPIDVFWQSGAPPEGLWLPDQGVAPYRGRG